MSFIPKRLKAWQPEHMLRTPMRRCHWCAGGPHRMSELTIILEGPMRYHFCSAACVNTWQQHRHDSAVVEWLKHGAGVRAKVLKRKRDAA